MKNLNCNQIKIFINLEIIGEEKCRVTVFRPSPLQWICREWGQKLGLMKRRLFWGWKAHRIRRPNIPGRRDPSLEDGNTPILLDHAGASLLSLGLPPSLGGLSCYLFLSSVHPPPTLISHPCLSSGARPLSYSFWRSVSCCGPHRPVQGSHPHQRGSGC